MQFNLWPNGLKKAKFFISSLPTKNQVFQHIANSSNCTPLVVNKINNDVFSDVTYASLLVL